MGQRLLGDFHFNGEAGKPDRAIAEEWYARAARQGDAQRAGHAVAGFSPTAIIASPTTPGAREWALKAAAQGVAASMTRLGLLYHNALGVERDADAAAQWWRKAPQLGDADGQAMLGAAHHLGAGVPRDPVVALALADARARTRAASSPTASTTRCARPARPSSAARPSARAELPLGSGSAAP